jgi:mRNA interferase MazF
VTEFQRGDVVICILSGDYGKPRPAVVIQSDFFNETHASVVVCPVSSELTGLNLFRIAIPESAITGLHKPSEVMVDKLSAVRYAYGWNFRKTRPAADYPINPVQSRITFPEFPDRIASNPFS